LLISSQEFTIGTIADNHLKENKAPNIHQLINANIVEDAKITLRITAIATKTVPVIYKGS
ncbi:MAG: hypothetical protein U2P89_08305, partial [Proteiniphilum sp.]|uniref:hypothetical protein n=1 Tax=Proteiniphilum sp. TaxID=1926877 RepID=UPI002ABC222F